MIDDLNHPLSDWYKASPDQIREEDWNDIERIGQKNHLTGIQGIPVWPHSLSEHDYVANALNSSGSAYSSN